jgi:tetratricopeptide (TPR) repeat protein
LSDARRFAAADSISDVGTVEHCVERAAGNPLFLEQLLRHAQTAVGSQAIPGSVKSLVQSRLDRLAASDRSVAQAAAILGQMVEPAAVAYLLDWDHAELGALASQLILRPNEKAWVFHHALVRDAVYEGLLTARRRDLHLRAAHWYAGRDPVLEAEHLDRAEDARAVGAYLAASNLEAEAYRHGKALQLAERALAISTEADSLRADIPFLLGELRRDLGEMAGASAAYVQALAAAGSAPLIRCRSLIGLAEVKRVTDDLDGASIDLDHAEQIASAEAFVSEEARIHSVRGNLCFPRGDAEGCVREHSLSLKLARRAGDLAQEATALGGLGDGEYMRGRMERAHEAFDRCVALSEQLGLLRNVAANLPMRSVTSLYTGRVREGLADALSAITAARAIGHARAEIVAHQCAFLCYASLRNLQSARPHLSEALELSRRLGARRFEAEGLAMRAEAHRREGKVSEAKRDIADALAISRETGMAYLGPYYLGVQARITEDEKEFRAAIAEAEELLANGAVSHNHFLFRCDAIDACLERRQFEEADAHADALHVYAGSERSAWVDFFAARARALAAAGRGRVDMAELDRLIRQGTVFGFLSALGELEVALGHIPGHAASETRQ